MSQNKNVSRRNFLKKSGIGAGLIGFGGYSSNMNSFDFPDYSLEKSSPREVKVLTMTKSGNAFSPVPFGRDEVVEGIIDRIRLMSLYKPDIICIFEVFNGAPPSEAETVPGSLTNKISIIAKELGCYIICPLYTKTGNNIYNSAVLIDREGSIVGQYNKCHPVTSEISRGVSSGILPPPVFDTDFGKIGIQICFDINWHETWKSLKDQGAEIVFWPSAYPGGRNLAAYAWLFKYYVVSAPWRDPAIIYDITGDPIACSGLYERWAFAKLNLEKEFLEMVLGYSEKFNDIKKKYGPKVLIHYYHDEDWATIESNSPEIRIKDILEEYKFIPHRDYIKAEEIEQNKHRN